MPNSVSAKKSLRKNLTRRARNRTQRSMLRSVVKKFREAVAANDATATQAAFRLCVKKLDQAAAKGVIHKNNAARMKSRLSKRMPRPAQSQ
jgi:small subunit ribosomal protein S20